MLEQEVIDLLNSRELWAFVGSGTSIDAGLPNWGSLVTAIIESLDPNVKIRLDADASFSTAIAASHFPRALSRLAQEAGLRATIKALAQCLSNGHQPGAVTQAVARWPFKSYITTNYDYLLETALANISKGGWTSLGNNATDSRITTRNAKDVVWHLHGGINVMDSSNFILTEEDYETLYAGNAPQLETLRSLLMQQRVLFIGAAFVITIS